MRLRLILLTLLCSLVSLTGMAQEDRGRINGLVTDPSGFVVPNATVTLLNEATHVVLNTVSDSAGAYIFEYVTPNVYTVTVTAPGFKQFVSTHVRVEVAAHIGVPARLELGNISEQVTVVGTGGGQLRTEDAVLGFTIESRSASELPMLYGSPFELQLLAPGVTSTTLANGNHSYEGGSESAKVNGSQSAQTEFTLDGAPDSRNGSGVTAAYVPSRNFIGEFRLITSPYDASMAHTSGGSIDTSIKSGTSQYHGSAAWFYQNPDVDAPGFTVAAAAPAGVNYDNESVELDGPILRRKLFFFAGYEHQHNEQPGSSTTQAVPTDAEKNGDFSALLAVGATLPFYKPPTCKVNNVQQYLTPYNQYTIFDPRTTVQVPNCPGVYMRSPYKNNVIPNIDPVAKAILAYYPEPTGTATQTADGQQNYFSSYMQNDYYYSTIGRLDYTINDQQKVFGHVLYSNRSQPHKNAFYPGASGQTSTLINKAGVLDYVNTLNATTALDVRYSFTRFTTLTSLDAQTTSTDLGINANAIAGANPAASGFPQVKISSYAALGNSDPTYEADDIHDGQVNLTKSLGRHQLKVGAEYRLYRANQFNSSGEHLSISSTGKYTSGGGSTVSNAPMGAALAEFEAGLAPSTSETLNAATANDTYYWSGFVQDDWKALPNLTINLGLRYEYGSPLQERNNKAITGFAFNTPNPIAAQAKANYAKTTDTIELGLLPIANFNVNGGLLYAGTPGSPSNNIWSGQNKNFSPRIGFSYSPTPRVVVRGGFGLFFGHLAQNVAYAISNGYTQTTNTVASNDNGITYVGTLSNPFPGGLTAPSGNSNGMLQGIGTSISFNPQNPATPYNERYSLGVQYALPGDMIFEADYVGNNGYHIRISRDYDALPDSALVPASFYAARTTAQTNQGLALNKAYATNPFQGITVPGNPGLTSNTTIAGSQLVRPYPEFSAVTGSEETGYSTYNALQLSLQKRFSHGYNLSVAYTRSKALDAISFLNAGDAKPWYGISNGDYPNVLSVGGIYELPFGKGKPFFGSVHGIIGEAVHGFQVQGTYRIQSGQPITFNNAGTILAPGAQLSDIWSKPSARNANQWFNTSALVSGLAGSPVYTSGEAGTSELLTSNLRTFPLRFNGVRQDYQNLLNVGALKKFTVLGERVNMDVRAEAINVLNHPVFSAPTSDPSSSSFGRITGFGNTSRVLQFAVEGHF